MCGIVGAVAKRNATPILVECLRRLEYRGYDSAGVALIEAPGKISRCRVAGKIQKLQQALTQQPLKGNTGIGHTRWATHGEPTKNNAHPHFSEKFAVVHNGIIENHEELHKKLANLKYDFSSETDTETIVHNIHHHSKSEKDFLRAVHKATQELEGMYALAILNADQPGRIIAVRCGSPLVIGFGIEEYFLASDKLALTPVANKFIYLEEGDIADITEDGVTIYDSNLKQIERKIHEGQMSTDAVDRGGFRHYMQKEIFEQPLGIANTVSANLTDPKNVESAFGDNADKLFSKTKRVQIVACGTSYHAGLIARYWLESIAKIRCQVEIASEFRYRDKVVDPDTLFVAISQSGETTDTLAAVRLAKETGFLGILAICNVPESSLIRESDVTFLTRAGAEIGVASTKAFTTQLTGLFLLTLALAQRNSSTDKKQLARFLQELKNLPSIVEQALALDKRIETLAEQFVGKRDTLFLGRGISFPVALEGALKLKEISYIHAEAYPAGELKHGPLALVDKNMPVLVVIPHDDLVAKVISNVQEVRARGGQLILFVDDRVDIPDWEDTLVLRVPAVNSELSPIVFTVPLQLFAYHVAVLRGTDVDQPRNLAKSVTVE